MAPGIEDRAAPPEGAVPRNLGQKISFGAVGVLLGVALLMQAYRACTAGPEIRATTAAPALEAPAVRAAADAEREVASAAEEARLRSARAEQELARRSRELAARQRRSASASELEAFATHEEVRKARLALLVQEVTRGARALQSAPLAQSFRRPEAPAEPPPAPPAPPAPRPAGMSELEQELTRETIAALRAQSAAARGETPPGEPPPEERPGPPREPAPVIATGPDDPPGWERIYEGEFLEAVLETQLSGELTGPVSAMVAVDYHSRDRRAVLVPQGATALGSASRAGGAYAGAMAISFHRLIFPDGKWVRLPFTGLNQVGSAGVKDQVNRHYAQLFGAAAAVGVLSGLAYGSDPGGFSATAGGIYAGGPRAQLGRSTAGVGMRILERFLNRPPTITIRAGHRLRVWFTSDVLVPRPADR